MTAQDAAEARARWLEDQRQGMRSGGRTKTLSTFISEDWLPRVRAKVVAGELRSSTVEQYERDAHNHLLPSLGKKRLRDVTAEDAERLAARLIGNGKSPDTARRVVMTLGYVLKLARRYRYVAFNPIADAEKPRPRRRTPRLPTLEELLRLAGAAPTHVTRALVLSAAFTGCRKAECFALDWPHVDLTEGQERLWIVRQWYKGELVEATKTRASSREIVLAPQAAAILRELSVGQQLDGRPNPHRLVFPSPTGEHWLDTNFDRRVWRPMREAAGLPDLKFHTLRYWFVSHVRNSGLPGALTEQLAGHIDDRTHRGYTRPIAGTEELIREALEKAFGGTMA